MIALSVNHPLPDLLPWGLRFTRLFSRFPRYLGFCERLFSSRLKLRGSCIIETSSGLPWKLDMENSTHRWIVYGDYEGPALCRWMEDSLAPTACILLSGANIGQMIPGIYKTRPRARIHAFEPNPEALDWLKTSLKLNPQLPITLHEHGLGDVQGTAVLLNDGDSSTHGAQSRIGQGDGFSIRIEKLDDVMKKTGAPYADLWILDVEGFELSVLKGSFHLLSTTRIKALWMEASPETEPQISTYLAEFGYRPHHLDHHGRIHPVASVAEHSNLLYLPRH